MTAEKRTKLRAFIARATELDGATLGLDAEGMTVEQGDNTIAYFPHDCQPMSETDEAYNGQVRFNAGLFLTCRDNLTELMDQVDALEAERDTAREAQTRMHRKVQSDEVMVRRARQNQWIYQSKVNRIETAIRACIARAGNPDAAEGCRQVIRTAQDALEGKEGG